MLIQPGEAAVMKLTLTVRNGTRDANPDASLQKLLDRAEDKMAGKGRDIT